MRTARTTLRDELTSQLLPALQALGFSGPPAISGNALVHEYKRQSAAGTHILTLQLEKYGRPRFLLTFCVEPPGGFERLYESGGTVDQGRLHPKGAGPTTRYWFRADPPFLRRILRLRSPAPAEVVACCVALLPEVEAWWQTRSASRHVSVLTHRFPGRQSGSA